MNRNKIITIIIALIMILGITVTLTVGFNVELDTKAHQQINVTLQKEFTLQDVTDIAKEAINDSKVEIRKSAEYEQSFSILAEQITEEQKQAIITKLNEKYQTELKSEDIKIELVPRVSLRDYVVPHIMELVWGTLAVILYVIIRYRKLKVIKVLIQTILGIIIGQILIFSIIAIARIEIGSNIFVAVLTTYVATILCLTAMFENKLQKIKAENEDKNKKTKNA